LRPRTDGPSEVSHGVAPRRSFERAPAPDVGNEHRRLRAEAGGHAGRPRGDRRADVTSSTPRVSYHSGQGSGGCPKVL